MSSLKYKLKEYISFKDLLVTSPRFSIQVNFKYINQTKVNTILQRMKDQFCSTLELTKNLEPQEKMELHFMLKDFKIHCFLYISIDDGKTYLSPKEHSVYTILVDSMDKINSFEDLSSFAFIRKKKSFYVLDSPMSKASIFSSDLNYLTCTQLKKYPLKELGFNTNPTIEQSWAFHDYLFHSATRNFNYDNLLGLIKPNFKTENKKKMLRNVVSRGESLSSLDLILKRRETKYLATKALNKSDIENLFRTLLQSKSDTSLNYPSAGAIYENNFYFLAKGIKDLEDSLYYYDKILLSLNKINIADQELEYILNTILLVKPNKEMSARAQGIIFITSNYKQISNKYCDAAYRLTLINTGVILQTLLLICSEHHISAYPSSHRDIAFINRYLAQDDINILEIVLP